MKDLSLEDKNAIRDALSAYCDNYLSRNRAAESLNGVSAATVLHNLEQQIYQHLR